MQIVSTGDNLHERSDLVFWEIKKHIINLSSAELVQRVLDDSAVCFIHLDSAEFLKGDDFYRQELSQLKISLLARSFDSMQSLLKFPPGRMRFRE